MIKLKAEAAKSDLKQEENGKKAAAQLGKTEAESVTRETGEELLDHRMLTDEVTGLCACSSTPAPEISVRPR